jgi:hypothetical protein
MDFVTLSGVILAVAVAVERAAEVIKPLYLQVKNSFTKIKYNECSKIEKEIMSILLGPVICIAAQVGVDLPGINEARIVQQVLAGLAASLGSNFLHTMLSIVLAIKNSAETVKNSSVLK